MDWYAIEETLIVRKTCVVCQIKGDRSKFKDSEFRKNQNVPVCLECMEDCKGELDDWTKHFCETCVSVKPANKFNMTQRQRDFFRKPHCTDCNTLKRGGLRLRPKYDESKARQLVCAECKEPFDFDPKGHITADMREHHFRTPPCSVICYTCHDKRPKYTCSQCKQTGPREDFQNIDFERASDRKTQLCLECKSGRRKGKVCIVDECKTFVREENLSKTHKINPSRAFVCDTCTENGYTPKNPETYTCSACEKVTGGHGLFQSKDFQRAAKRGTQKCKGCFQ